MKIFTIYDTAIEDFSDPMPYENEEYLSLYLEVIVNTHLEAPHHRTPERFAIFEIAEWDRDAGHIQMYPEKKFVNALSAYKKPCKYCKLETEDENNG